MINGQHRVWVAVQDRVNHVGRPFFRGEPEEIQVVRRVDGPQNIRPGNKGSSEGSGVPVLISDGLHRKYI